MSNNITFTPTLSDSIFSDRFNQIDKIFSTLTGEQPISQLPNYNLLQIDQNQYQLICSVPGYSEDNLDVKINNSQLNISGKCEDEINHSKKKIKYIHKNINNNNFSITFNLQHPIIIIKAILEMGLLKINFKYDIPEHQKHKKIHIQRI